MKLILHVASASLFYFALTVSSGVNAQNSLKEEPELSKELLKKDADLFNAAFNTCHIKEIENILSKDFVFSQDKGMTNHSTHQNRQEFIVNIQQNFCNNKTIRMRREVIAGSHQVFPKSNDEAIQTGVQRFYMVQGIDEKRVEESKFFRVWKKTDKDWKMSSEVDFDVNTKFNDGPNTSNTLYKEIIHMDSLLFNAYNAHDADAMQNYFTKDLEFYHDKGGLISFNQAINGTRELFKQNNKIRREVVEGSLEVYPIKDYGAIQVGTHRFCHDENGKQDCGTFKFIHVWKKENGNWQISRVVSYDH